MSYPSPFKLRRFELLESRRPLAGNVTAALVGADLVITGDAESNAISMVETANDGEFVILAESDATGIATTLNGTPNGSAVISGVTGNIVINMHGGADVVKLANIHHTGGLTIDAGKNDTDRRIGSAYSLSDSSIGLSAVFRLGVRAGSVAVQNTTIGGSLVVPNSEYALGSTAMLRLGAAYAGVQLDNVIATGSIYVDSSVTTLIRSDNVFAGDTFRIQGHSHYNAFLIHNTRAVGGFAISTVTSGSTSGYGLLTSLYDFLDISGVIADGGLYTDTNGDARIAYSYFGGDANITTNRTNYPYVIDTNEFAHDVKIMLGKGDQSLDFKNSIVNGTLLIEHTRFAGNGPGDPQQRGHFDGSTVMTLANNRIGILRVFTGHQTDEVRIDYSVIDQLFATLDVDNPIVPAGGSSDLLEITGSIFNRGARIDGRGGFDLFRSRGNTFNGLALLNFEAVQ